MERFIVIDTGELCEGREAAAAALVKTLPYRITAEDEYERRILRSFVENGTMSVVPGRLRGDLLDGLVMVKP
jgi:hypothetical protein